MTARERPSAAALAAVDRLYRPEAEPRADAIRASLSRESKAAADLLAQLRTDDAELAHDMIEGETNFLEALGRALDEIDQCEIMAAGCKAKVAEIEARRERAEGRAERIRAAIEQAMTVAEMPTARLPTATLTVKQVPPKPVIEDEALIPSEFWVTPAPRLDKAALNKAAKERAVPGVSLSNGTVSLQIRRA